MDADRWEYRAWPEDAAEIALRIKEAAEKESEAEYRTDTYILSGEEALLPKIRGGERFEIKELLETRAGCEHWMAAVSEPFPVSGEILGRLIAEPMADLGRDAASLAAGARSYPGLVVRDVRKHRRIFAFGASTCEITQVMIGEDTYGTVGVEAPSLATCTALVELLGLGDLDNIDYGSWLRSL